MFCSLSLKGLGTSTILASTYVRELVDRQIRCDKSKIFTGQREDLLDLSVGFPSHDNSKVIGFGLWLDCRL